MRPWLTLLVFALLAPACDRGDDRIQVERTMPSFFVDRDSIASVHLIGRDSLSDAGRITRIVPEPDGRTIAVLFTDTELGIAGGLALVDPERQRALLVWPDSVKAAWWRGDHRLVFETDGGSQRSGLHAIVNVHVDSLEHLEAGHDSVPLAPATPPWMDAARERATAYVDSVRDQPDGIPRQGTLRYHVTSLLPLSRDSLAAFYVAAHGRADERLNAAWYLLHVPSGRVAPVDSVIGRADELPLDAAAWASDARFMYAQGTTLYSARVAAATRSLQ